MHELKEKAVRATRRFLDLRGYDVIDVEQGPDGHDGVSVVARDDGAIVFIDVHARHGQGAELPEEEGEECRGRREALAAAWLSGHAEDDGLADCIVRFDSISVLLVGESRAMIRHHINCLA